MIKYKKLIFLLCIFLLGSCGSVPERSEKSGRPVEKGQLTLYLDGPEKSDLDISFELTAACFKFEDGSCKDVLSKPVSVNSRSIRGSQLLAGETELPRGKYSGLRLSFSRAEIKTERGASTLALPPDGIIELPFYSEIERDECTAVFINWNADDSVQNGYLFNPILGAQKGKADISSLLLFISNEGSGNISVINRNLDRVVSVLKTGKGPKGIATSLLRNSSWLYVANYGSNTVSIIDPIAQRTEHEIIIRFGKGPQAIVPAVLADGREMLYVVNQDSNNVSVVDTSVLRETASVNVGDAPVAITADPPLEEFERSHYLSVSDIQTIRDYRSNYFNIYVVNSRSNTVSVLKADSSTGEVKQVTSLKVEYTPVAIQPDAQHARLYVVNHDSEKISVINMVDLIKGNSAVTRLGNFGPLNSDVLPDPVLDRLYILREFPGELTTVMLPRELNGKGQFDMLPVLGIVALEKKPRSLLMDKEERKIYVVNRGSDSVSVLNKSSRTTEKRIPVGKNPYEITSFSQF